MTNMIEIQEAYRASPTIKNARRLRDYLNAHPMVMCMFDEHDNAVIRNALDHATRGY